MPDNRYTIPTVILHWTMALAIALAWLLAQLIDAVPRGPARVGMLGSHVLVGLAVLALLLPRVLARLLGGAPEPPEGTPGWQARLAAATHLLLYALMLAQPLTGIAFALARRSPVEVLGLFALPNPLAESGLRGMLGEVHEVMANLLLAVVALHVAATLWHVLVKRDEVLWRMAYRPRREAPGGPA